MYIQRGVWLEGKVDYLVEDDMMALLHGQARTVTTPTRPNALHGPCGSSTKADLVCPRNPRAMRRPANQDLPQHIFHRRRWQKCRNAASTNRSNTHVAQD